MVLAHAGCSIACGQEDAHTSPGMMSWPALRWPQQKAWKQTEAWGPGQSGGRSNASSRLGAQFSSVQWSGGCTNCRTQCFPRCPGDMNVMFGILLFVRRTHREPTFPSRKCCRSTQVKRSVEVKMIWIPSYGWLTSKGRCRTNTRSEVPFMRSLRICQNISLEAALRLLDPQMWGLSSPAKM